MSTLTEATGKPLNAELGLRLARARNADITRAAARAAAADGALERLSSVAHYLEFLEPENPLHLTPRSEYGESGTSNAEIPLGRNAFGIATRWST